MEQKSYSYGVKLTGVILHFFFTILLTISLLILGNLVDKSILTFTDIGTKDFLKSAYYTKYISKKCDNLGEYMHLLMLEEKRTPEENRKYLQYTDEFKSEDTNFCYWYKCENEWYTNQPDTKEGQQFDPEKLLMEAKSMGDYLLYDMEHKTFGTNIKKLSLEFFESKKTQMYWPSEGVILIIGIDTQFSGMDDLYYASEEYQQIQPWIKTLLMTALISVIGWIIVLMYLTLAAGRRIGEEQIHLNAFDRIKTEPLLLGLVAVCFEMIYLMISLANRSWELSSLLVAAGTISLVTDAAFLLFYLSLVKLMKAEKIWENSVTYWLKEGILKTVAYRNITLQAIFYFALHLIICFVLAVYAFHRQNGVAFFLLVLFCAMEGYFILRKSVETYHLLKGVQKIRDGELDAKIEIREMHSTNKILAEAINNIGTGLEQAVKESTKNERMKADLITNVSHDIKTPLTSIVNYVNLLKREDIQNERAVSYIKILEEKAARLKQLTEDLVEASKVSSGNVKLDMQELDFVELVYQTAGEFNEKFEKKELTIVTKLPNTAVRIRADGRQLYRVIENLYNNVAKYAMERTRVYVEVSVKDGEAIFSIKNVSERALAIENCQAGDLTERFTRGDGSRTTEGSGLGLSIAKSLTQLMGGQFDIAVDGDLFKATLVFENLTD